MNINQTLSLIKEKCENFSNLPESMKENINKNEIENYLIEILKIDEETTKNFIDLIYDDNEEDKNNVSTNHFIEKYTSLLKILETTESDDEEKNIKNKNDINEKEIEFGGSPIKDNHIINIFDDDTSIDPDNLFKELNFNKINNNNNLQNQNFYSIIRPSNNFNFGSLNNLKIEEDLIKKESNQKNILNNNKQEEQILNSNNINSLKYDLKTIINNNNSNNNFLYKMINNQRQLSIKQKLQDVFFQIHKPNDIKRYNVYPLDNTKRFSSTLNINKNYKTYVSSPMKSENYLNQFQNKFKILKNYSLEKNNYDKLYSSGNFKKNNINKKLEGLNKILFAKNLDEVNHGDNILNPDDFLSLEDRLQQFEKKKIEIKKKHNKITNDINSGSIILNENKNEGEIK
jgi:hypothetical protein